MSSKKGNGKSKKSAVKKKQRRIKAKLEAKANEKNQ